VHSLAFANRDDSEQSLHPNLTRRLFAGPERERLFACRNDQGGGALMPDFGSIMTLSYLGATRVMPHYNVMGTAKAALESSVRYLAADLGPRNIRVKCDFGRRRQTASARAVKDLTSLMEFAKEWAPMKRLTDPAEVGDAAAFLASNLSRGVTGNVLFVDAGMHMV